MSTLAKQHHERSKDAIDRPKYREGNRDRAVKVFTINKESVFLLIQGVPDVKITRELLELCSLYGAIDEYRILDDYPTEPFTKVYWIKYQQLQAARVAKRKLDDHSFYGGVLHVCYAPEYETVSDTRLKLQERRKAVARRLRQIQQEDIHSKNEEQHEYKTNNVAIPTPEGIAYSKEYVTNSNKCEATSSSIFNIEAKQTVQDQELGFPALPDPPRRLPIEEWKHHKHGSDDDNPRIPSAHSTLPHNFNPYPVGFRPPGPHQIHLQPPRHPEQNQFNDNHRLPSAHSTLHHNFNPYPVGFRPCDPQELWPSHPEHYCRQFEQSRKPHSQFEINVGPCIQPLAQPEEVKRQDIKLVPLSVTRKRSSAQANLSRTPNEHGKRMNSGQVGPSRTGITLHRHGQQDVYEQPSGSNQTGESCSFKDTVECIRNKMKMVSKAPTLETQPAPPPSSSSERIRI